MQLQLLSDKSAETVPSKACSCQKFLKSAFLKILTHFTNGCIVISHTIDNNSNNIDYCPNNSSLDRYTQNVVLDIFEEVSEFIPARSFLIVVNVVLRLFNPVNNYILEPRTSSFVPMYCHTFVWHCYANSNILHIFQPITAQLWNLECTAVLWLVKRLEEGLKKNQVFSELIIWWIN